MSTTVPAGGHPRPEATGAETADRSEDLREQALASLKRKRKFWEDLTAYVAVNGVLWLIWALADRSVSGWVPWPAWVSMIWGFLLAVDAWRAFAPWPSGLHRPIGDEEVERELQRMRRR